MSGSKCNYAVLILSRSERRRPISALSTGGRAANTSTIGFVADGRTATMSTINTTRQVGASASNKMDGNVGP